MQRCCFLWTPLGSVHHGDRPLIPEHTGVKSHVNPLNLSTANCRALQEKWLVSLFGCIYLRGWKEPDLFSLLLPSPTLYPNAKVSISLYVYWVPEAVKSKLHNLLQPEPPCCDIDLRFFICMVVDHNYPKSCEATLSYQSSLRGTWIRYHISSFHSQVRFRPFRHSL